MCEDDKAVDAWMRALVDRSVGAYGPEPDLFTQRVYFRAGHMQGVIRELAATVPGVREWLIANMPGEGG